MRLLVGGYTTDGRGQATGIGTLLAGAAGDALAGGPLGFGGDAVTAGGSPSWIAAHPSLDVVYAALEGDGAVRAFRRTGEASFDPLGEPVEAGETVCHVAVAPDGASLIASCWGDGRVVGMTLDAAGQPSAPTVAAAATDPYGPDAQQAEPHDIDLAAATRALREAAGEEYAHLVPGGQFEGGRGAQEQDTSPDSAAAGETVAVVASRASRAHQAIFLPGGVVATTDMGWDLVRIWRLGARGLAQTQQVVLPLGSGPRHTVWHPSGHLYVLTELSHEVFVLAADPAGRWRIVGGTALGVGIAPDDTAAELCTSRDGGFVYAGVRGSNTIATLRVLGDGSAVTPVALVEAGVDWPRHHVVARDTLLVAGQRSDEVASITLDLRTGVPGRVRYRAPVPTPTCLLPVR